jgi:hypothetical protein
MAGRIGDDWCLELDQQQQRLACISYTSDRMDGSEGRGRLSRIQSPVTGTIGVIFGNGNSIHTSSISLLRHYISAGLEKDSILFEPQTH